MHKRIHGYTVVELIVTILLVSIVSVVAYPRLPSFSSYSLDAYCAELKSGIRRVQTQAMSDVVASGAYRVEISADQVVWSHPSLTLDNSQDCIGTDCSILIQLEPEDRSRGIEMTGPALEFDSFGRLTAPIILPVDLNISASNSPSEVITINQEGYIDGCR